jgi:hypothetical protein
MIAFFESGRLGNQLLQYAVLRDAFPNHRLLFFGLAALRDGFRCERSSFVTVDPSRRATFGFLRRLFTLLAKARVISEAEERRDGGDCGLVVRHGLLRSLILVRPSYFHHARFERCIPATLAIDPGVQAAARRFVTAHAGGRTPIFLHVRRGDYLHFPDPEAPAALPASWILRALDHVRALIPRPIVFVCSDDLEWVRQTLASATDAVFCERGELGDLAVMASCAAGVLSPSSFSWWGAFFARRALDATGRTGLFVAPRYWIGHRKREWYPTGYEFSWITYLEPVECVVRAIGQDRRDGR